MAKPRKPKALKMPKKPKASASLRTMENYLERRQAVEKKNKANFSQYEKDLKKYNDLKKKIAKF